MPYYSWEVTSMGQAIRNSGQARQQIPATARQVFPNIPVLFECMMPKGFRNDVNGWTFTEAEVAEAAKGHQLLTLDIDMGMSTGKEKSRRIVGGCSLGCPHCFRRQQGFTTQGYMGVEELFSHLREAKKLGLRSVKLIGPGEPLEEAGLLWFLKELRSLGITPLIFTKAHVLGDDALCMKIHGMDGVQLATELEKLGVSLLVGATSFIPGAQDFDVRKQGYHAKRNLALERIVAAGFTKFKPGEATRLALVCTPVTPRNLGEIFDMYVWARQRNIQPVMAPTMIAGKALDTLSSLLNDGKALASEYAKILVWAVQHNVMTLGQLLKHGVPAYAGGAWCNQVAVGLFVRGDHKVLRCPGDDISIQGDLRVQTLEEIWLNSENVRKHAGQFNNGCPPKEGKSFPAGFFEEVLERVREFFANPH
jgi:MoaA/NifB/PqqE/SkfB family radical SAM enzyme